MSEISANVGAAMLVGCAEKCNFVRRFASRFLLFDATIAHRVAVKNQQKNATVWYHPHNGALVELS